MIVRSVRRPARRGAAAVETALVLSLSMAFILGIFEYGRLILLRNVLENAAREGARQAVIGTSTLSTAQVQAVVTNYLANQPFSNLTIQVYAANSSGTAIAGTYWYDAQFGESIAVQVDADYTTVVPALNILPSTVHLTVKSVMKSEAG